MDRGREWTPFSSRGLGDIGFGLPMNRPQVVDLAPSAFAWDRAQEMQSTPPRMPHNNNTFGNQFQFDGFSSPVPMTPASVVSSSFPTSEDSNSPPALSLAYHDSRPQTPVDMFSLLSTNDRSANFRHEPRQCGVPRFSTESNLSLPGVFASSILFSPMTAARMPATVMIHGKSGPAEDELFHRLQCFFTVLRAPTAAEARVQLAQNRINAMITNQHDGEGLELVTVMRQNIVGQRAFVVCFSKAATASAKLQTECMAAGMNMVTDDVTETLSTCLRALKAIGRDPLTISETFKCPLCHFDGLMQDELSEHVVLFHGGQPNAREVVCPICRVTCKSSRLPFPVHIHKVHSTVGRMKQQQPRKQHHTYIFALVVCQRESDGKFLLVNEPASWGWWIPGGRVEWGEGLRAAAVRETKEEAGVDVNIEGVLKIEYASGPSRTRQRMIFFARPINDNTRPKSVPDYESRGACWVSLEEVDSLPLRGEEPRKWFHYIANGGRVYPMSLLAHNRDDE